MRGGGTHVRETKTSKHSNVIVGRVALVECQGGDRVANGFGWKDIVEIGGHVKRLNPKGEGKRGVM